MSRLALTVCLMELCFGLAFSTARATDWTERLFPERSFDFGTVARGSKIRHVFRLVNPLDQPIRIADMRSKCGCTEVRAGAREIPPGMQTTIEAVIDTTTFEGAKASGLTLVLDRPEAAEVDLSLTCFIRSDIMLKPGLADFGILSRSSAEKRSVQVELSYHGEHSDWAITRMQSSSPYVLGTVEALEPSAEALTRYRLTVTLDPTRFTGLLKEQLTLFTNDATSPAIPVMVTANVQSALSLSPSTLALGSVRSGALVERTVLLRAAKPFRVLAITPSGTELSLSSNQRGPQALYSLKLTWKAPAHPGAYSGFVTIATDLRGELPVKLRVLATVSNGAHVQ